MSVQRDHPYTQFNFLVDLGDGETGGPGAGFQECSGIGIEVQVVEYRNGNDKTNDIRKLTGLTRVTDVTLRRGIIGSLALWQWLDQTRNGDQAAIRDVLIHLQSEDHASIVQSWKLHRARPTKYVSGPLNAKGNDVAVEEITLAYERLEME
jgi:phage tail-like protein